jgi:hypothetical protein
MGDRRGVPSWQQSFRLEALLLTDPGAVAEEAAWLALPHTQPAGQPAMAQDLLLAGLAPGHTR